MAVATMTHSYEKPHYFLDVSSQSLGEEDLKVGTDLIEASVRYALVTMGAGNVPIVMVWIRSVGSISQRIHACKWIFFGPVPPALVEFLTFEVVELFPLHSRLVVWWY
jgi:hypothetical protein